MQIWSGARGISEFPVTALSKIVPKGTTLPSVSVQQKMAASIMYSRLDGEVYSKPFSLCRLMVDGQGGRRGQGHDPDDPLFDAPRCCRLF